MIKELKRIIAESEVMKEDDNKWPKKNVVGKQELEIRFGNEHVSFEVKKKTIRLRRQIIRITGILFLFRSQQANKSVVLT